jgi:hypothetical protein
MAQTPQSGSSITGVMSPDMDHESTRRADPSTASQQRSSAYRTHVHSYTNPAHTLHTLLYGRLQHQLSFYAFRTIRHCCKKIPCVFQCSRPSTNSILSFPCILAVAKDLGKSAVRILLLLSRSRSAESRCVLHCGTVTDSVLYTATLYFSHLLLRILPTSVTLYTCIT